MAQEGFDIDPFGNRYAIEPTRSSLGLQPPPDAFTLDTRPYDQMQATPRGFISGLFSDVLGRTLNMPSMPRTGIPSLDLVYANRNPLFNMMGVGDVQKTAERISYGEPLTTGSGMTLKPREETMFAGMAVAPLVGEAALLGTRGVRTGARMVGQEIADRVATGRSVLPSVVAEPRPSLFAVEPSQMMPKPQAPVSNLGFYSAAEQAALNLPRNKGTGQSFLNDLMKAPDVKKDELSWIGLDDFLKDKPNVTKQEVQDFIANNKIDLQEVQRGANVVEDPIGLAKRKAIFDKYEPQITALYREMDNPSYVLISKQVSPEEYQRGVVLQNRVYRGEPITAQEQAELDNILVKNEGAKVREFANNEEARNFYLSMSKEDQRSHMIQPKVNSYKLQNQIENLMNVRDAEANAAYVIPEPTPTRYGNYQLPLGENYREILLKLPEQTVTENRWQVLKPDGTTTYGFYTTEEAAKRNARYIGGTVKESVPETFVTGYKSPHWGSDLNVLAHMRVNDRIDADGKKMLLVEEIQSDWHQAGRESGYRKSTRSVNEIDKDLDAIVNELRSKSGVGYAPSSEDWAKYPEITARHNALVEERNVAIKSKEGVPDAPFKDTWYQLALKRILKYAADNGYERVGLTTGKTQAERYDLSKQIKTIIYGQPDENGKRMVEAITPSGDRLLGKKYSPEEIQSNIGKEMADKIKNSTGEFDERTGTYALSGLDLKIGGEGMKKYYDEIYPKFLEKYGKKWDAGVGETRIKTGRGVEGGEPVRYIDITPKMKESIKKGQPLASAEQTPEMLASGGLNYADPFRNPLLESTIG